MILADTSAWVEYDRGTGSAVHRRLAELIGDDGPLAVTEPVLMEVLAGAAARSEHPTSADCSCASICSASTATADFDAAARIYRTCRRAGVTPRGIVDCMIASVAMRHDATLLAADADLTRVAGVVGIIMDEASAAHLTACTGSPRNGR